MKLAAAIVCVCGAIAVGTILLNGCGGDDPAGPGNDTTPPTVTSVYPAEGTQSFAVDSTLRVTFSENMAPASLSTTSLLITPNVVGTVSYSNRVLTFTPISGFADDVDYTVTVDTTVTDVAGNRMAAAFTWSFGTNNPPIVQQTLPLDGAQGVYVSNAIVVIFSEEIDSTALPSPVLTFSPVLAGTVWVDSNRVIFSPTGKLQQGQMYTATLAAGISDTAGNTTANPTSWAFTTAENAIASPGDEAVVGDTVVFQVTAADAPNVDSAELTVDGMAVSGNITTDPYEFTWDASVEPLGSAHSVAATMYDSAGGTIWTDTITVHHHWRLLIADDSLESDGIGIIPRDLKNIYVRSTATQLQFRVETTRGWELYEDSATGIDVAIFIDADRNASTGRQSVAGGTIPINDIGAEYRTIVGVHGDSIHHWSTSGTTLDSSSVDELSIADSARVFEVGFNLSRITGVNVIDIVVANAVGTGDILRWDWAPNPGGGHATYVIDRSYPGDISKATVRRSRSKDKQLWSTENPFD